jgi:gliding motility-associated-like protein
MKLFYKHIIKYCGFIALFSVANVSSFAQMEFVQNKGQWEKDVLFKADDGNTAFFIEPNGFTVLLNDVEDLKRARKLIHDDKDILNDPKRRESLMVKQHAYKVKFLGSNVNASAVPEKPLNTYNNYFIGNDSKKWASNCGIFAAVTVKEIYPNIDIKFYSAGSNLKYDFIVKPGGNPNLIALRYDGGVDLTVKNKQLVIGTKVGELKELEPYTYETSLNGRNDVNAKYIIKDNVVNFNLGNYNADNTLIIDPSLVFSTFTGSRADNFGFTATYDNKGNFYAGGIAFDNGFPAQGGFTTGFSGRSDIAIIKFNPNGAQRLYGTYIGGNDYEQPHSLVVDANDNLVLAGRTRSVNYPTTSTAGSLGNYDIVVTKLNATGNGLVGSMKIGGSGDDGVNIAANPVSSGGTGIGDVSSLRRNYGDDARSEVIIGNSGEIFVASCTQSGNFPTVAAAQASAGGNQDGVILKLNPSVSNLLISTFYGGGGNDACFVAALNPISGNLFIGGSTASPTLLGSSAGVVSANSNGNIDGFVTELNPNSGAIIRRTFIGTGANDLLYGLKFDKLGFPYVMGTSTGNFPVQNATFFNQGAKQFVAKLQTDLSAYVYSTVFGTNVAQPNLSPIAFSVDRCENVYVSGWGGGLNSSYSSGNTSGLASINPIAQAQQPDGADFYFFVMRKDATQQLFGSHFGQFGGSGDHVDGGTSRFDPFGIIYQGICANCNPGQGQPRGNYPNPGGVWSPQNGATNNGNGCNMAAVKIDMNFAGVGAEIESEIDGVSKDTLGCLPLTVKFKDLRAKGNKYYWNFDSQNTPNINNDTTTTPNSSFTFTVAGTYRVRLISEDLSTCNLRDTVYLNIKVGDKRVYPDFTATKRPPCESTTYDFINTTTNPSNLVYKPNTFIWNFGDGSPAQTADFGPKVYTFPSYGTYIVKLTVTDDQFCNVDTTAIDTLRINPLVDARPTSKPLGCAPYLAKFTNQSLGGLSWLWEFYDSNTNALLGTSTEFEPSFLFVNVGTYSYRLIAFDSTTCNKIDTSNFFTIEVKEKPIASFTWAPNPPLVNTPTVFTNQSQFADTYLWNFGDGESSTEFNPTHQYNATQTFNAQLIAYSNAGCSDTLTLPVRALIDPLLDVPNAFIPGKNNINSVVFVRGFGIGKIDWKIFNRWGQLIFRTNSRKQGWDGTFKGKIQPIDTYTYVLDVEYTDGVKFRKTGDINLLR